MGLPPPETDDLEIALGGRAPAAFATLELDASGGKRLPHPKSEKQICNN
jgi:hypothetical protein